MSDHSVSRRSFIGLVAGAATMAGLAACGGGSGAAASGSAAGADELSGSINCTGATSFQGLIEAAANKFMETHEEVTITIGGGGSGQGLSDVKDGKAQLGRSDAFAEEKLEAADVEKLADHQICVVGMGPIVNPSVDVDNLTLDQLRDIFTGKVTNWSEVGGSDGTIQVINRKAGSGTRATFEAAVLRGAEVPVDFKPIAEEDSSGTVVEKVAQTEGAISYLAFSYFDDSKFKAVPVEGVEPTNEKVTTGDFPIWAYEHVYSAKEPDEVSKAFLDYLVSDDVQGSLVEEQGFIPITDMKVKKDAEGNVTEA